MILREISSSQQSVKMAKVVFIIMLIMLFKNQSMIEARCHCSSASCSVI